MDSEWLALIREALAIGISEEDIREFFESYIRENDKASD